MTSPLVEPTTDSLDALFNLDPLKYTEQDLDKIIEAMRKGRAEFLIAEGQEKKPRATKAPKVAPPKDLDLAKLGL